MRGQHDEAMLLISAYCVPQTKGTEADPATAYMQKLREMIQEGNQSKDPRQRLLNGLQEPIASKCQEGHHPILMLDANDDWEAWICFTPKPERMVFAHLCLGIKTN